MQLPAVFARRFVAGETADSAIAAGVALAHARHPQPPSTCSART